MKPALSLLTGLDAQGEGTSPLVVTPRWASLVAFPLDLSEGRLQRAVVVHVEGHVDFGVVAGFMEVQLATAHPAFERFVIPQSSTHSGFARPEGDLEGAEAA